MHCAHRGQGLKEVLIMVFLLLSKQCLKPTTVSGKMWSVQCFEEGVDCCGCLWKHGLTIFRELFYRVSRIPAALVASIERLQAPTSVLLLTQVDTLMLWVNAQAGTVCWCASRGKGRLGHVVFSFLERLEDSCAATL